MKRLHMIGNAHLDPVWLWQWQEGFHEIKATFRSALDRMNEYPDFIFTSSSVAYYEWIEHNCPSMFEEIKQRAAEGRWVICGGWWIQPDCNLPNGESFVRQGLCGQRYLKEKFGVTANVGYNVDSFGHHAMLPQILKKSGLDYYVMMRPMDHEMDLPSRVFQWESDDGSQVLSYRIPIGYYSVQDNVGEQIELMSGELELPLHDRLMCFYGVGNHGGGPTKKNIESVMRLRQEQADTEILFSSPDRFFADLTDENEYPIIHAELQMHAIGCYSAHSAVKRWNRQAENLLMAAEKLSVIGGTLTEIPCAAPFGQAWKNVLFNQFHDILPGTSILPAFEDALDLYGEARTIASRAMNHAMQAVSWSVGIAQEEGMTPIVVFNPHAWRVSSYVELEFGHPGWVGDSLLKGTEVLVDSESNPIPFQEVQSLASTDFRSRLGFFAELPALGYRVYRLYKNPPEALAHIEKEKAPIRASDLMIENEWLKLEINAQTGAISRLFDKKSAVEVFEGDAAKAIVLEDLTDTWSHGIAKFAGDISGEFEAVSVKLIERGSVKSVIRAESRFGHSQLIQQFTMYADSEQIDVDVTVDWRERHRLLKLHFPVPYRSCIGTYEIPYGHIERPLNGNEVPALSWVDLTGEWGRDLYGLSILNDGKYSFDMGEGYVRMTVLRSPIYAHHEPVWHPKDYIPIPGREYDYMDQGAQSFRYSLLPHTGNWKSARTVKRAAELNMKPISLIGTYHEGILPHYLEFVNVDCEHVIVSVVKPAEDGDGLIIRCYETNKAEAKVTIDFPHLGRTIRTTFGPCEIRTFRIPADKSQPITETNLTELE
ncbi:alpha-mannosidase [Cohnella sp. WQ 127256]|uniref:alpha-mannosidase n=1 Tax=Cohnella sp. WQ 127256 TaxID=2938790 RepID=UPI0021196819|nr:alpha-mannosidase [Cohnella sp. WQ 127256]